MIRFKVQSEVKFDGMTMTHKHTQEFADGCCRPWTRFMTPRKTNGIIDAATADSISPYL